MKPLYIIFLLFFANALFAQDTIYVFSKSSPIQKFRHRDFDSISVKKPTKLNADTLIFYSKIGKDVKLGMANIDSIRFKPSYVKPSLASLTTSPAIVSSATTVILGGNLLSTGGGLIKESGVFFGSTPGVTATSSKIVISAGIGNFKTVAINKFDPASTYYFRAYAINDAGITLGNELSFTVPFGLPTVETGVAGAIGQISVRLNGKVSTTGGSALTSKGFLISTSNTLDSPVIETVTEASNDLVSNLTGLLPNTTYYYATFATNAQGTSIGKTETFKTQLDAPKVTTVSVGKLSTTTAEITGFVLKYIENEVFDRGVVYGTSPNPTIATNKVNPLSTSDTFRVTIPNLTQNTTYYARAYARSTVATVYGEEKSFKTLVSTAALPKVITGEAINISSKNFDLVGEITDDGGAPILEIGLAYGSDSLNLIGFVKSTQELKSIGKFIVKATGLIPEISISVRAYAKNEAGIAYGKSIIVKTVASLPIIDDGVVDRTDPLTRTLPLRLTIADLGSNIGVPFKPADLSVGYVISTTNKTPTLQAKDTIVSADVTLMGPTNYGGDFFKYKDGNTSFYARGGTKYYIRGFATNRAGTGYSKTDSVTTDPTAPDIKQLYSYRILDTCYFGFRVENNGGLPGNPTEVGYRTQKSFFDPAGPFVSLGSPRIGDYNGKVYSPENEYLNVIPTTRNTVGELIGYFQFSPVPPGVPSFGRLKAAEAIGVNTATIRYSVVKTGGSSVSTTGILISTNPDATGGIQRPIAGGIGDFFENFTELKGGTTYYYKAFAINSSGTGYGEIGSFTTLPLSVGTTTVTALNSNNVTLSATVTNAGESGIQESGFVYSTSPNPTVNNTKANNQLSSTNIVAKIENMLPFTRYYAKAYARNGQGFAYGPEMSFTTLMGTPVVEVLSFSNITQNAVEVNCNVVTKGGQPLTNYGIDISTDRNNMTQRRIAYQANVQNTYTVNAFSLIPGKTYFVRAYVFDKDGKLVVSPILSFSTLPPNPVFGIIKSQPSTASTMILTSELLNNTENGNKDILEYGFCYNLKGSFVDTNAFRASFKNGLLGTLIYIQLNNLNVKNTYVARPFILSRSGLFYGNLIEFTPLSVQPTVSTLSPTAIGAKTIVMNISLDSKGQGKMIRTGLVYSANNPLPAVGLSGTVLIESTSDTTTGTKTLTLTNLIAGNTYRFRAFAENSKGISYGSTITLYTTMLSGDLDGNVYDTVVIGGQTWMTQNLKTRKYNDGTPIFNAVNRNIWIGATPENIPEEMYGNYKFSTGFSNDILGLYYNYAVVETQKVCPYGWHVPSEKEYQTLVNFNIGIDTAGFFLKKQQGYPAWANPENISPNPSKWAATPGAFISNNGTFDVALGYLAYWWTSTKASDPRAFKLYNEESAASFRSVSRFNGLNIRCIKD